MATQNLGYFVSLPTNFALCDLRNNKVGVNAKKESRSAGGDSHNSTLWKLRQSDPESKASLELYSVTMTQEKGVGAGMNRDD